MLYNQQSGRKHKARLDVHINSPTFRIFPSRVVCATRMRAAVLLVLCCVVLLGGTSGVSLETKAVLNECAAALSILC